MKYKDYFSKLKDQGKINNEDYAKFLETVPEGEMPDAIFTLLDQTYMTAERAASHKDVHTRLKAELLDPIDRDIKKIMALLPAEKVLDIERESSTYKKLEMVRDAIPAAIAKAQKAPNDEEAKKKLDQAQHTIQELTDKFANQENSYKTELQKIKEDAANENKNFRLNTHLEKLANSYTLADAHKETRDILTKALLSEIKAKNKLDLVETNGDASILVLGEDGKPRYENNGNTPVTIKSLLDSAFKPLLKVSGVDGDDVQQQQTTQQRTFKVDSGKPASRQGANVSVQL
jgi:hypothetical protein